ncbi:MAG: hypothetical protein CMH57_00570 [Myxococcales bacterium]|nr:hypothetical protein [Myxococcales bacterium]
MSYVELVHSHSGQPLFRQPLPTSEPLTVTIPARGRLRLQEGHAIAFAGLTLRVVAGPLTPGRAFPSAPGEGLTPADASAPAFLEGERGGVPVFRHALPAPSVQVNVPGRGVLELAPSDVIQLADLQVRIRVPASAGGRSRQSTMFAPPEGFSDADMAKLRGEPGPTADAAARSRQSTMFAPPEGFSAPDVSGDTAPRRTARGSVGAPSRSTHSGRAEGTAEPGLIGAPTFPGFHVTRKLGQGGMGSVWQARQEGTNRDVAIKVLDTSGLGDEARTRFALEIEVTALLDHPNIGRLYESHIEEEQCYYAMEFIDGEDLTEHLEDREPEEDRLLQIMLGVCRAVQYAHQKGIIHRDLKPDNIMITTSGAPKVVDFGIAKLIENDQATGREQDSQLTSDGTFLGTPAYMSPEQIKALPGLIDTRTDVYALGVILYELFVGDHPHGEKADNMLMLFMTVVNEEPRLPSNVKPGIDKDIEALLLKAIARDPAERYATAGELADDLKRYIEGEPLLAQPQTTWYVLRKKIAKNRGKVALAASLVLFFAAFATFSYLTVLDERNKAEAARELAVKAQDRAEKRFELGREFANTLIFDLDDKFLDEGMTKGRAMFVAESRAYLNKLKADAGDRADVQEEVARAYVKIGEIHQDLGNSEEAEASFKAALSSYEELKERAEGASPSKAVAKLDKNGALDRGRADSLYGLADLYRDTGDYDRAESHFKRASKVIAARLKASARDDEARQIKEKIFQARGKLAKQLGDQEQAAEFFMTVLKIRDERAEEHPKDDEALRSLASSYYTLGNLRLDQGKVKESHALYTESLKLRERMVGLKPGNTGYRKRLATGYVGVGIAEELIGDYDEALEHFKKARTVYTQQSQADPKNQSLKINRLWTIYYISSVHIDQKRYEEAGLDLQAGLALATTLAEADPANETIQRLLVRMYLGLGLVAVARGDTLGAAERLGRALAVTSPWAKEGDDPYALDLHSQVLMALGENAIKVSNLPEARVRYNDGLEIRRELVKTAPNDQSYRRLLARTLTDKAILEQTEGKKGAADALFDEAAAIYRAQLDIDKANAAAERGLKRIEAAKAKDDKEDKKEEP